MPCSLTKSSKEKACFLSGCCSQDSFKSKFSAGFCPNEDGLVNLRFYSIIENQLYSPVRRPEARNLRGVSFLTVIKVNAVL